MSDYEVKFTRKEQRQITDSYFKVLRITESYYEIESKNTGHLWIVKKQHTGKYPVMLYHKHAAKNDYYHKQRGMYTVIQAIIAIKEHDIYVQQIGK